MDASLPSIFRKGARKRKYCTCQGTQKMPSRITVRWMLASLSYKNHLLCRRSKRRCAKCSIQPRTKQHFQQDRQCKLNHLETGSNRYAPAVSGLRYRCDTARSAKTIGVQAKLK